jgi:hypothetical protein
VTALIDQTIPHPRSVEDLIVAAERGTT